MDERQQRVFPHAGFTVHGGGGGGVHYGNAHPARDGFSRSPAVEFAGAAALETTTGNRIMLAITYQDLGGGQVQISGYRDGIQMGTYSSANFATWAAGDQASH